ncbi:hypothetical protein DFH06DRAFT_1200114 [Mycena polygramma]|nr:hypothetical protein DFH06DRAFT_1200114 [Mycena polygramma]
MSSALVIALGSILLGHYVFLRERLMSGINALGGLVGHGGTGWCSVSEGIGGRIKLVRTWVSDIQRVTGRMYSGTER